MNDIITTIIVLLTESREIERREVAVAPSLVDVNVVYRGRHVSHADFPTFRVKNGRRGSESGKIEQ